MSKAKGNKHGMLPLLIVLLAIAIALVAMVFVQGKLLKIRRTSNVETPIAPEEQTFETDEEAGPDTLKPEEIKWEETKVAESVEGVTNILLIGQDARTGEARQRSDTMIICSLNEKTKEITLASLMRDMYVPIPGYDDNRINAAYAFGGMPLLDQVIEEDFGVKIDGNIEVNLEGFLGSMEAIGDLDLYLTASEAEYMNSNPAVGSGDDTSSESWYLEEGINTLTPSQALGFARMRNVGNSDYRRTERQREVLYAAFHKLIGSDLSTLLKLSDEILPSLTTDLTSNEIVSLVTKAKDMKLAEESYRIPVDGTFSAESIRGMSVLVPDLNANSDRLKEYLYGDMAATSGS